MVRVFSFREPEIAVAVVVEGGGGGGRIAAPIAQKVFTNYHQLNNKLTMHNNYKKTISPKQE